MVDSVNEKLVNLNRVKKCRLFTRKNWENEMTKFQICHFNKVNEKLVNLNRVKKCRRFTRKIWENEMTKFFASTKSTKNSPIGIELKSVAILHVCEFD